MSIIRRPPSGDMVHALFEPIINKGKSAVRPIPIATFGPNGRSGMF